MAKEQKQEGNLAIEKQTINGGKQQFADEINNQNQINGDVTVNDAGRDVNKAGGDINIIHNYNAPPENKTDHVSSLIKKFNLYLLTFVAMLGSWYFLHKTAELPEKYLYPLACVPFLILVLTDILPKSYKQHQIKKLIELGISGNVSQADYFRLQPYEAADYERFQRADKAHEKALQWLLAAQAPWLYLTGLSGSGKSSLLQAFVIPELEKQGYRVLIIRSFANPLRALAQELQKPEVIWKNPPKTELPLAQRLQEACAYLKKEKLLLVFDQFEEFVILQNDTAHQALQDFLTELDSALPANLRFLAVVRTDYMGKLSELTLPERFEFKQSAWFDVSPFTLSDARQFLQASGLNLNPALCEKVLTEAVELEESRGLIRPITLNILGVVLAWFSGGGSLKNVQAGQLIRTYLQEALNEPSGFAPQLVAKLLSEAGTKLPRSEADLMAMTALSKGVVRGCLIHLSGKGLVRELDKGVWEISHDFIARLLSGLVWRWRVKWWKKASKFFSYSGLIIWLIVILIGYPTYQKLEIKKARDIVDEAGITTFLKEGKTASIILRDARFKPELWQYLIKLNTNTILINNSEIREIDFPNFPELKTLAITGNDSLNKISNLNNLTNLESLQIYRNDKLKQLPDLNGLTMLKSLHISSNEGLEKLPILDNLKNLRVLKILNNKTLKNLPNLNKLTNLQMLQIGKNDNLKQLPALDNFPNLTIVVIQQENSLNDLQLHKLASLKKLFLLNNENGKNFSELFKKQRLSQKLNAVEIELGDSFEFLSLENLKELEL